MKSFDMPKFAAVLAVLTLLVVIGDAVLVLENQKIEADVQRRQQFINQNLQVTQLGNALVQALAVAATNNNDTAIRALLVDFGAAAIPNTPPASGAPQAP